MKRFRWQIVIAVLLVFLSFIVYLMQIEFFHRPGETVFYLFQDLAFVPLQILIVTLLVDKVMSIREKSSMMKKLNMVIGVFFAEVGNVLLALFAASDAHADTLRERLTVTSSWTPDDFSRAAKPVAAYRSGISCSAADLETIHKFLGEKKGFLLNLLENPNLLEHERFTDLLWAVTHLAEELSWRDDLKDSPPADIEHLNGDVKRAYSLLLTEWLAYMKHLCGNYPYLFSLAVRMSPLDPAASPVVGQHGKGALPHEDMRIHHANMTKEVV
ncbi:MAG TPA: hypothetical protein P5287_00230 [bacterium]|nr:hypothetical protein [bacterium]